MQIQHKFYPAKIKTRYEAGEFNKRTKKIRRFTEVNELSEILDVIAAAAEGGALDRTTWVSQVFADEDVFWTFLSELEVADDMRINDRWYHALQSIIGSWDEYGFVTHEEIANELRLAAARTYQI